MSKGIGAVQRRVLDSLIQRRDNDWYSTRTITGLVGPVDDDFPRVRARWRWYTADLLDLVEFGAPRGERVSIHRAVHTLHRRGRLDISTRMPYDQPYGAQLNEYGEYVGGVDLSELATVDHRWPTGPGRHLWFRLKAPRDPEFWDDQICIVAEIAEGHPVYGQAEDFEEFAATLDRSAAWNSTVGQFLRWLFCGSQPGDQYRLGGGSAGITLP